MFKEYSKKPEDSTESNTHESKFPIIIDHDCIYDWKCDMVISGDTIAIGVVVEKWIQFDSFGCKYYHTHIWVCGGWQGEVFFERGCFCFMDNSGKISPLATHPDIEWDGNTMTNVTNITRKYYEEPEDEQII